VIPERIIFVNRGITVVWYLWVCILIVSEYFEINEQCSVNSDACTGVEYILLVFDTLSPPRKSNRCGFHVHISCVYLFATTYAV